MKIYFTASMSGMRQFGNNYRNIVDLLRSLDHIVIADHILRVSPDHLIEESLTEREEHFKRVRKWVGQAELVVAEVSHPSTNVGYEISMALEREKPVICLHVKGRVPVLLVGIDADRLQVLEYEMDDLKTTISDAIEYVAEQQDTRFNFFISPKHGNYLDWVSKTKKVPRAVYLRELIEKDMEKNKDYEG